MATLKTYIGLIGAGVAAIGFIGWRTMKKSMKEPVIHEGDASTAPPAATVPPAAEKAASRKPAEHETAPGSAATAGKKRRPVPEAKKTSLLAAIAAALKEQNADEFTIRFGQSRQRGYRGYYLSGMTDATVFVGWSKEYESAYHTTPFWIELDPSATARFKEIGLESGHDIYPHPTSADRILIALPRDIAGKPEEAASMVLRIARETLI